MYTIYVYYIYGLEKGKSVANLEGEFRPANNVADRKLVKMVQSAVRSADGNISIHVSPKKNGR